MAVAWQSSGAIAAAAGTGGGATALTITAPACAADDILIAIILIKSNTNPSPPDGSWTQVHTSDNTSVQSIWIWWKKALASCGDFTFTRASESINWYGAIVAFRGCNLTAPIDASTPTASANASSDTVTYATFNPTETTGGRAVAVGVYNEDNTTAGAIAGTNPTFTNRLDVESGTGADGSIFLYEGDSDGAATGARSHTTTSTNDAINIGVLFGLVATSLSAIGDTVQQIWNVRTVLGDTNQYIYNIRAI